MFITNAGLKKLDEYKYKSGGYSKLDNMINPFWEAVEKLCPRWMAPNLITLIGFVFMALSYLCMIMYDQTLTQSIPRWTFFFAAICQFIYQTMDAVDGKHARETKASSPLGQLFDHGCDSFSITFMAMTIAQSCKLYEPHDLILFVFATQMSFYASNWSEYHTKVLRTHVGNVGVTESELLIIFILFMTGILGPDAWDFRLISFFAEDSFVTKLSLLNWFLNIQFKHLIIHGVEIVCFIMVLKLISDTMEVAEKKVDAILQYIPVVTLLVALLLWKDLEIFKQQTGSIMLTFGLIFSLISSKLIVCSLTHMKTPHFSREAVIMMLTAICIHFFHEGKLGKYDAYMVWGLLLYVIIAIADWSHECILQITGHLGICCFSLEKRPKVPLKQE